jgi:hypothetical protein
VNRGTAVGAAGLMCAVNVSGCLQFDKALGQQQVDVYFQYPREPSSLVDLACLAAACHPACSRRLARISLANHPYGKTFQDHSRDPGRNRAAGPGRSRDG